MAKTRGVFKPRHLRKAHFFRSTRKLIEHIRLYPDFEDPLDGKTHVLRKCLVALDVQSASTFSQVWWPNCAWSLGLVASVFFEANNLKIESAVVRNPFSSKDDDGCSAEVVEVRLSGAVDVRPARSGAGAGRNGGANSTQTAPRIHR